MIPQWSLRHDRNLDFYVLNDEHRPTFLCYQRFHVLISAGSWYVLLFHCLCAALRQILLLFNLFIWPMYSCHLQWPGWLKVIRLMQDLTTAIWRTCRGASGGPSAIAELLVIKVCSQMYADIVYVLQWLFVIPNYSIVYILYSSLYCCWWQFKLGTYVDNKKCRHTDSRLCLKGV